MAGPLVGRGSRGESQCRLIRILVIRVTDVHRAATMGAMDEPATTPEPPYYAVIFTSVRNEQPGDEYDATADQMFSLAARQPGYLGVETANEGIGITVSYWSDPAAIEAWKRDADHAFAQ